MIYQNLGQFLDHLDRVGELVRVRRPVSVDLEMAEIADRTMKLPGGGPALLFERPLLPNGREAEMPVAINVFGSWSRISAALGVENLQSTPTASRSWSSPRSRRGSGARSRCCPSSPKAWWYALGNIDPERDVRFTRGPVDDLDHQAQHPSFGSKMGIDGTRKWPEEGFTRRWPDLIEMDADVRRKVDAYWQELGIEPRV